MVNLPILQLRENGAACGKLGTKFLSIKILRSILQAAGPEETSVRFVTFHVYIIRCMT